jgi:hypothetical protein
MNFAAHNLMGRRAFLRRGIGLGLLGLRALGAAPQFPVRAKRVIFLYMSGGPSQFETFDNKPELKRRAGEVMPASLLKGVPVAQLQGQSKLTCFPPQFSFTRRGRAGIEVSSVFPHLATVTDELTVVRSMTTDAINHDPAHTLMNTGAMTAGRPSMGSWIYYGLGAETENLPGFVVLMSTGKYFPTQPISSRLWQSGFLPARTQGVRFNDLPYLNAPAGTSMEQQKLLVGAINKLQALNPEGVSEGRLDQYEAAFRLQTAAPEVNDFSKESPALLKSYGVSGPDGSFGANCLLARRMAERGVRFIQVYHREWDHHSAIEKGMITTSAEVDQGCAALIRDLKARDMLKDTLVVWAGEFGRTPMAQADGRDHHMKAFSIWMAGGGVKAGFTFGKTDDFGYNVIENPVHVNDLHATMLYLLGLDHKQLTVRSQGRDMRLTDVGGRVVKEILA